jgi:hypothetical protein
MNTREQISPAQPRVSANYDNAADKELQSAETMRLVAQACDRCLGSHLFADDLLDAIISELDEADRLNNARSAQIE